MVNLSGGMNRISKGYVTVPNENKEYLRYYAEVWLDVFSLKYQLRIFRKGASLRYPSRDYNQWNICGNYIYIEFQLSPQSKYDTINDVVDKVIKDTEIVLFNESRMFLKDNERELLDFTYCVDWTYEECCKSKPSVKEISKKTFKRITTEYASEMDNFIKTKQLYSKNN